MDQKDKELLNRIQTNFPIHPRPYAVIAQDLKISEDEVIHRIQRLKLEGHIRRLGGTFDSGKLGYRSTLCTLKAPNDRIAEISGIINAHPGVTHNYIRDHAYNMWFTLIAESLEELEASLEKMREKTGIREIHNLPAKKVFKIKVDFKMGEA